MEEVEGAQQEQGTARVEPVLEEDSLPSPEQQGASLSARSFPWTLDQVLSSIGR